MPLCPGAGETHVQAGNEASPGLAGPAGPCRVFRHLFWLLPEKTMLTVLLLLAGLVCFAIFFKAIDFFDKI